MRQVFSLIPFGLIKTSFETLDDGLIGDFHQSICLKVNHQREGLIDVHIGAPQLEKIIRKMFSVVGDTDC